MRKIIGNILYTMLMLSLAWFVFSYIEILTQNLSTTGTEYNSINLFEILKSISK